MIDAGVQETLFFPLLGRARAARTWPTCFRDPWSERAARLAAAAGLDVLVIDTAPETVPAGDLDPLERLAWRALELERSRTTSALARSGVSVSPWRGPGTLDAVLTAMSARRARVP